MVGDPFAGEAAPAAVDELVVDALVFVGLFGVFAEVDLFGVEAVFAFGAVVWVKDRLQAGSYGGIVHTGGVDLLEGFEVLFAEGGAFAEAGHVGAKVVDPDVFGAVFFLQFVFGAALGEEQHIGFYALSIKDAGGQAQDGVQVALVHQVAAHVGADASFEQHVIR